MSSSLGSPMDWEPSEVYNPGNRPHTSPFLNQHPQQTPTPTQFTSAPSTSPSPTSKHLAKRSFAEFVRGQDNEVRQPPPARRRETCRGAIDVAAYAARLPLRIPSIIRGIARSAQKFVRKVSQHATYRRNTMNAQAAGLVQAPYSMPGSFIESPHPAISVPSLHNSDSHHLATRPTPSATPSSPTEMQQITPHASHEVPSFKAHTSAALSAPSTKTRLNLKHSKRSPSRSSDRLSNAQNKFPKKPYVSHHDRFRMLREKISRSPDKPLTYDDFVRHNRLAMYSSPDREVQYSTNDLAASKPDSELDKARIKYNDVLKELIRCQKDGPLSLSCNLNPVTTVFTMSVAAILPDPEEEPYLARDWIVYNKEEPNHAIGDEGEDSDTSSIDSETYRHFRHMLTTTEDDTEAEAASKPSEHYDLQQSSPSTERVDGSPKEVQAFEVSPAMTNTTQYSNDFSVLPDASPLPPKKQVRFKEAAFPTLWAYEKDKPFPEKELEYDPDKAIDEPLSPLGTPRFAKIQERANPVTPDQVAPPSPDTNPRLPKPVSSPQPPPNTPVNTPVEVKNTIDAFNLFKLSGRIDSNRYDRQIEIERAAIEAAKENQKREEEERKRAEEQRKQEEEEQRIKEEEQRREEARKEEERKAKLRIVKPLSSEKQEKVSAAMSSKDPHKHYPPFNLTRKDLGTVLPQSSSEQLGWLNDEVINEFLSGVVSSAREQTGYSKSADDIPKYVAFNTHLYPTMQQKGYSAVARWVTRAKIAGKRMLGVEKILIPIHQGNHWTLLEISGTNRTVTYYDSLNLGESPQVSRRVQKYLDFGLDFVRENLGKEFEPAGWRSAAGVSARQQNGKDCGVFVCLNGLALVAGLRPRDALDGVAPLLMREQVAATLLTGFEGDFAFNVL